MRLGEFHTIEVTFKGTLLLLLKGVQADLTLSPEDISYGSSPWVMLSTRFFGFRSTLEITLVYLFDAMQLSLLSLELLQAENFHQTKVLISTYFDPICFEKYVTKRLVKSLKYESKMSDLNINGKVY